MNGAEISATAALAGSALGLPILATVLRESFVKPEVDETFIGGKARNMHKDVRSWRITGTGGKDKVIVMGMLERGGKIKAGVINDRITTTLHSAVIGSIAAGAEVIT
jgi:hypothetical protein